MSDDPTALLKKHGKTFNFARLFLGKKTGMAAARLYRFCRIVDDIADDIEQSSTLDHEQGDINATASDADPSCAQEHPAHVSQNSALQYTAKKKAKQALNDLIRAINENQKDHVLVGDFLQLCEQWNIDRNNGIILIEGVSQDIHFQALATEEELIKYAFKVAGVVGLMMAPILGASKDGNRFAVDLGIAMQLTNIARDVLEDASMQRRYVPGEWVAYLGAEEILAARSKDRARVQAAISGMLVIAEKYYESGLAGLYYLPYRNRQAIAVAAYAYREIGRKLSRNNYEYWRGRTYIGAGHKIKLASQALWHLSAGNLAKTQVTHNKQLHQYLDVTLFTTTN